MFARRCIDVINFLGQVSFEGDHSGFAKVLSSIFDEFNGKSRIKHNRNVEFLRTLSRTKFSDLVMEGGDQDS